MRIVKGKVVADAEEVLVPLQLLTDAELRSIIAKLTEAGEADHAQELDEYRSERAAGFSHDEVLQRRRELLNHRRDGTRG